MPRTRVPGAKSIPAVIVAALLLTACTSGSVGRSQGKGSPPGLAHDATLPAGAPGAASVAPTGSIPLKDALGALEPQDVWQRFYELTQVPRPSHHEERVREFLVQFGNELGLETLVDGAGNVLIRKPAAQGMARRQGVILQAHMDMVWQQAPDRARDLLQDPIEAAVNGEWVVAEGTTLGADDGIGMAMAMAILQSEDLELGPIEALFTVNEEDGMDGALGLDPGLLTGSILINLDQETEGEFLIGSAGGEYATVKATYAEIPTPSDVAAFRLTVRGLKGGHSGVHIHLGRGHATKLMVRFLKAVSATYGLRLVDLEGGTAANAIPREASAVVVVPETQVAGFLDAVQQFQGVVQRELAAVEPDLAVQATPADRSSRILDPQAQQTLIDALYATPQGVMRMSDDVPGLVETSTNLGIVMLREGQIEVKCLTRSSVDSAVGDVTQMIASVWDLAGMTAEPSGRYTGWRPAPSSPILGVMQGVYRDLYGQEAQVRAIHAGLECGTIGGKVPGLDMISIGPTLEDVHSPAERLKIASVKKVMDLLVETLRRIPEK